MVKCTRPVHPMKLLIRISDYRAFLLLQFPAVPMDQALDPDVLTTLMNLGCFNDEHTLREKLSQTESNIEKMVYYLLLERKFLRPAVQDIDFDVSDDESEFLALSFQGQLHGSGTTDPFVANRRASTNGSINELLDPTAHENIRKRTDSNLSLTQSQSQYLTESVSRHRYMSVDAALGTSPECTVVPISTGTSLPSAGVSRFATISAQSIIHEDLAGLNHTGVHGTVRNGSDVLDNHNRTHTNTASTTGRSSGTGNAVLESPSIKVPDKPVKDSSSVPNRTADKPVASKPRLTLNSETVEQNRKSLRCPSKKAPIPLATIDGSNEELSRQMGSGRESPKVLWFQELFGEKNVRIVSDDVPRDKLFQGLVDILDREHIKHQISGLANRCTITCQCSCEGEDSKGFDIPMEFKVDVVPAPEKDSFVIILMHISGDPSRFLRIVDTMKTGVRHLDPSTISQP
ncbi:hypothetical protein SARC_06376 [Sphaeroforma arctica JP610]|uniref:non-specific serine/threonine protein kinase n=1 Tax=Sphaeroforma arctica JP610 TaxID=667725 RepID=A0A0L0FXK1_9EUKA|nr:hypothetical protein SARC_06376 [Sphaeroforma arctica JP610]KNC81286.1 hypothetical protein SARC_06376 [Sphaeroforma arctica JP610]|eukprot:XP_014155188.1 hypothetical protein SARC_06376 [Sphaeroforma arctica JP610]